MKSPQFDESKQSSSNCKKAMHDLDGASDQDTMFGHPWDETIAYSLTTSMESHVKETAQTDSRSASRREEEALCVFGGTQIRRQNCIEKHTSRSGQC